MYASGGTWGLEGSLCELVAFESIVKDEADCS
jgi:hypothetical protein